MQATPSSALHQSLHFTPHLVYLLLLTKRSKERRGSWRGAATEPDGPTLPSLGIVSLSATWVFLSPTTPPWSHLHLPLSPCLARCFAAQLPQEELLMFLSELSRQGDGTPLDFMTVLLRRAEIPKTASWEGKSSMLSFQVRLHSRGPTTALRHWRCTERALKELVILLQELWKLFFFFAELLLPTFSPLLPAHFPARLGLVSHLSLLYSPFSHIYQKQRAEQREFLPLCSCPAWIMKKKTHIKLLSHCFSCQPGLTSVDRCFPASVGDLVVRWRALKPPNLFLVSVSKNVLKVKQLNNVGFSGMANRFIKEFVYIFKYIL